MQENTRKGFFIGTMSGTSADGLDIVIADISSAQTISQYSSHFIEYPDDIATQVKTLQLDKSITPKELSSTNSLSALDARLAVFFARHINFAINKAGLKNEDIIAIGNHGQTIMHQPNINNPFSLQICNAQQLSNLCNIPVIADFRSADIAKGGQGAPLIPAFHEQVCKKYTPCAVVNIGGIANTSLLNKNSTIGFDNGPGNTLMNAWIYQNLQKHYDDNGSWARSGIINQELLTTLLSDEYFSQPHPKSTGQDYFNIEWLNSHLSNTSLAAEDIQATLCELTAKSIINDIYPESSSSINPIERIFICGGGAKNRFLMERLEKNALALNPGSMVESTIAIGIDTDWMEALGFAWLAYCYCNNINSNLPSVTGAREETVLGQRFNPIL